MKSLFTKLGVLLLGATFAVVGCTDFAEDIREVSDKVDKNMADVTVSTEALDDAIEDLKAQQAADKAAAETALAGLKTSLEGKIQTDIAAAEAKLEAAYKAADQVVTTGYTNADAALKAELIEKINEAKKAAEDANKTLEDALEAADKAIEDAYKAEDVKINASIAALQSKLDTEVARVEGLVKAVEARFDGFEEAYKNADIILDGKIADLSAELKKVDEAYKLADANIKTAYEAADAAINKRIDDAEALIADLQKADTDLQAAIDANKKSAEDAIKAEADARVAAIEGLTQLHNSDKQTLLDAIKVNSDAISAEIKAREDADKNLQANIDAANDALAQAKKDLEDADKKLEAAIKDNDNDIEALQKRATALEARVDALESWKTTAQQEIDKNKADIANLTTDLSLLDAAYKAADKALQDNIDKVNTALDEFKTHVDETYAKKTDLDAAKTELKGLVTALEEKVNTQRTELEKQITDLDKKLSELIEANGDAIEAEVTARKNAIEAVEDALAQAKKDLEAADSTNTKELEGKISNLKKELEDAIAAEKKVLEDAIAAEKKAREDAINEVNGFIDAVEADVESLKKEDIALDGRLDVLEAWKTTAQDSIDDMSKRLAGVEVKLDKVWGRIQSLVYVPEFSDGKATINYAQVVDGSDNVKANIESRSELVYKVYPDTLASIIADKEILSFDVEGVTVRSVPGVDLNIVDAIGNDENGTITLVVEPRGFADDFYGPAVSGKPSYSVALIVNNGNDYFSSEYTNLIASANEKIYADLYNSSHMVISGKKTDAAEVVEIAYNNDSTAVNILEGHYLGFHTASAPTTILTLDKMVKAGYDLEVASPAVVYDYYNMNEDGTINTASDQATAGKYFNATKENGLVTVKLSSDNETTSVGFGINPVYTYDVYGMSLSAGSIVQIVKEKRQFDLGSKTATWNYMLDAAADAYIFNSSLPVAKYERTFTIPASEIKLDNVLNESYADVINSTQKSLTVNGVASTAVTFGVDANNATVKFVDFEWGKDYKIVAKYDTGSAIVDVVFRFNTVDRTRDDIIVKTDTTKSTTEKPLIYKKDMKILKNTYKYAFGETLFKNLGTNIAGIEEDAYLKDIFVDHAISNVLNTFFDAAPETDVKIKDDEGADSWATRLIIDPTTREFTFGYAYNSFDGVVYTNIKYVKEFTSWYGQKFILEHVIVIDLPKYNLYHAPYYVKANANNDGWYSKVMGQYTPSINAKNVSSFSVAAIDMDMAFNVVNETESIIPADKLGDYGLKTEFSLEKVVSGITMTDNEISYMSPEAEIGVTGKLFIVNGNGSKVELPTRFNDVYANYVVKKYDPIGKLVASEETVEIIDVKKYEINVLEYFTLKDNRNETEVYDLIVDGAWLNGDGTNGYNGLVTTIYGLNVDYAEVVIPAGYVGVITFNSGVLTFDNSGNLTLMEDVVIPITLKINYTWGSRTATFTCTFPKNVKEPVTE